MHAETTVREAIFHEFKKYGKILSILIMDEYGERTALVSFRRSDDAERAYDNAKGLSVCGIRIRAELADGCGKYSLLHSLYTPNFRLSCLIVINTQLTWYAVQATVSHLQFRFACYLFQISVLTLFNWQPMLSMQYS